MSQSPSQSLQEAVAAYMAANAMPQTGTRIIVAVSGGVDSVALALILLALGYDVTIAHLDHAIRGVESDADAAFVKDFAQSLRLPCHLQRSDVPALARASSRSLEMAARDVRYRFLFDLAEAEDISWIATGHHLDDQAETVLLRLARGTSPTGLAGIPPLRTEGNVTLIRPLLACRRSTLEAYVRAQGHAWREDLSNADPSIPRNRVRHLILPAMRELNLRVEEAIGRLANLAREEDAYLEDLARALLARVNAGEGMLDRPTFNAAPKVTRARALVHFITALGGNVEQIRIEKALRFLDEAQPGKTLDLGSGILLRNTQDIAEVIVPPPNDAPITLRIPGKAILPDGRVVEARILSEPPTVPLRDYCTPTRQVFDAQALGEEVVLRRRRDGDRFAPIGLSGTRKLKDYLSDLGLPMRERNAIWLVTAKGEIAWVMGHAMDTRQANTSKTLTMTEITISKDYYI